MTHLGFTILLGAALGTGHALLGQRRLAVRLYHAGYIFVCSLVGVIGGSWVMHWIEG